MGLFRTFLIAGLTLALASTALAKGMSVQVCNRGDIAVSAAQAYEESSLTSTYWVARGWYTIPANRCMTLYDSWDVCDDEIRYFTPCARVRITYRFTDSTGVRGTAEIRDANFPPGGEMICVTRTDAFHERRSAPSSGCSRPGWILVPAAVKIDTYYGNGPPQRYRDQGTTLDVALSSRDRARPLPGADGSAGSQSPPPPPSPGKLDPAQLARLTALGEFLDDAIRGPGTPGARIKFNGDAIANVSLTTCVAQPILERVPWADRNAERASAAKTAIRQFLSSHWFREAASQETSGSRPYVLRRIQLAETGNAFTVQEVSGCSNENEVDTRVPVAGQPPTAQAPSAKPPPAKPPSTTDGGFGDLMGPGGFIKPPPK